MLRDRLLGLATPGPRHIIQITSMTVGGGGKIRDGDGEIDEVYASMYALCNDGTIWCAVQGRDEQKNLVWNWSQWDLPPIPQPERVASVEIPDSEPPRAA